MFAVIRTGGKQYKVATDDVISVERLTAEPGTTIDLGEVLMISFRPFRSAPGVFFSILP